MMLNLIIVEDNKAELRSITELVEGLHAPDISVAATFRSAKAVLKYLEDNHADIIISDIQMPGISGLELVRRIRESGSKAICIFTTCYDEFEYAKEAIGLDVLAYILKPVDKDELKGVLDKAVSRLTEKKRMADMARSVEQYISENKKYVKGSMMRRLLFGGNENPKSLAEELDYFDIRLDGKNNSVVILKLIDGMGQIGVSEMVLMNIISDFVSNLSSIADYYSVDINDRLIAVIISSELPTVNAIDEVVYIQKQIEMEFGLAFSAGISNECSSTDGIHECFLQAKTVTDNMFCVPKNYIMVYDSENVCDQELTQDFNELKRDVENLFAAYDDDSVAKFLAKYFSENEIIYTDNIRCLLLNIVNFTEGLLNDYDLSINTIVNISLVYKKVVEFKQIFDVKQWVMNFFRMANEIICASDKDVKNIYGKVVEIVQKRFAQRLTLQDIANEVYFSKRQVHRIFLEKAGMSVQDYITEYRIEQAKKMLQNPESRVYQVALDVGYKNKTYFVSTFKNIVGMTPTEYKESLKNNENSAKH